MTGAFPVRTAAELMADPDFEARWRERESIGGPARAALRDILARFVADGGPIEMASLAHPAAGAALTLAEAFRLGAAIFGERLPRLLR